MRSNTLRVKAGKCRLMVIPDDWLPRRKRCFPRRTFISFELQPCARGPQSSLRILGIPT